MAPKPIIFAMANPDPEITPGRGARRAARLHHRDGTVGLPQPGEQRPGASPHHPRRARRAREHHQRRDEIAAAEALAMLARETCRGSGRCRCRQGAALRPRIQHPERLRPALISPRLARRREGGDGQRCGAQAAARPSALRAGPREPARRHSGRAGGDRRFPCATTPSAWSFRGGRGGEVIRAAIAFRHAGYGTPVLVGRRTGSWRSPSALGIPLPDGIEIQNARVSDSNRPMRNSSTERSSATASCSATASGWSTRPERLSPPACRDGGGCARHRHHAVPMPSRWRASPWRSTRSRGGASSASPSSSVPPPPARCWCRHGGARTPGCGDARRHRPRFGGRRAAARARTPRRLPVLLHLRDPRGTIQGSIRDAVKLLAERGADFEFDGEKSADVALDPGCAPRSIPSAA